MTITPEERAELRRLHEVYAGAKILHNEHPLRRTFEKIFTGQFGNILDALEAAERERDRLREQGGELFLSGQVAKLREERDAAIAKCEQLAAELEACKAKLAEVAAKELLTRSLADEAWSICRHLSHRTQEIQHDDSCPIANFRSWALGEPPPECDCFAWDTQLRIEQVVRRLDAAKEPTP